MDQLVPVIASYTTLAGICTVSWLLSVAISWASVPLGIVCFAAHLRVLIPFFESLAPAEDQTIIREIWDSKPLSVLIRHATLMLDLLRPPPHNRVYPSHDHHHQSRLLALDESLQLHIMSYVDDHSVVKLGVAHRNLYKLSNGQRSQPMWSHRLRNVGDITVSHLLRDVRLRRQIAIQDMMNVAVCTLLSFDDTFPKPLLITPPPYHHAFQYRRFSQWVSSVRRYSMARQLCPPELLRLRFMHSHLCFRAFSQLPKRLRVAQYRRRDWRWVIWVFGGLMALPILSRVMQSTQGLPDPLNACLSVGFLTVLFIPWLSPMYRTAVNLMLSSAVVAEWCLLSSTDSLQRLQHPALILGVLCATSLVRMRCVGSVCVDCRERERDLC